MTVAFGAATHRPLLLQDKTWVRVQRDLACGPPMNAWSIDCPVPFVFGTSADAEIPIDLDLSLAHAGFSQCGYNAEKDVPELHP
jgi:hypothetical protein